jgi:tetratricopeptide (TPR) repeat protein
VKYCQEALQLQLQLGDHINAAATWDSLGFAHRKLGERARAITCYENALELYRRNGYRVKVADTLAFIADIRHEMGDLSSARVAWHQAYDLLEELGHADAAVVLEKLERTR